MCAALEKDRSPDANPTGMFLILTVTVCRCGTADPHDNHHCRGLEMVLSSQVSSRTRFPTALDRKAVYSAMVAADAAR